MHPENGPCCALRAFTKASHNRRECGQDVAPACEPPHATATVVFARPSESRLLFARIYLHDIYPRFSRKRILSLRTHNVPSTHEHNLDHKTVYVCVCICVTLQFEFNKKPNNYIHITRAILEHSSVASHESFTSCSHLQHLYNIPYISGVTTLWQHTF